MAGNGLHSFPCHPSISVALMRGLGAGTVTFRNVFKMLEFALCVGDGFAGDFIFLLFFLIPDKSVVSTFRRRSRVLHKASCLPPCLLASREFPPTDELKNQSHLLLILN